MRTKKMSPFRRGADGVVLNVAKHPYLIRSASRVSIRWLRVIKYHPGASHHPCYVNSVKPNLGFLVFKQ